jgi:hypothetical protein
MNGKQISDTRKTLTTLTWKRFRILCQLKNVTIPQMLGMLILDYVRGYETILSKLEAK